MEEIYQPLRIYTAQEHQLRVRQGLINYNHIPTLVVSKTSLIPMIIRRVKSTPNNTQAEGYAPINFTQITIQNIHRSSKTYNVTNNLIWWYGIRDTSSLVDSLYDYALYKGDSTITALPQGVYQIYFLDDDSNEFYSETFRIWFPDYTCKFEFRNSNSTNDLWFNDDFYYRLEFETFVYSSTEYDELLMTVIDSQNGGHNKKTSQRKDEILAVDILTDSKVLGSLHIMEMCDEIYFTDQIGQRNKIDEIQLEIKDSTKGGHVRVEVKFRIIGNMITSKTLVIGYIGKSIGEASLVNDKIVRKGRFKLKKGDKVITKGT